MKEEEKEVTLVAGIINATGKMLYWKDEIGVSIGNYAIVENMNDYDLVKVVGIVNTRESSAGRFSNTKYKNMKKVLDEIPKVYIESIKE